MAITAGMVKELREMTGAGMMDCKKSIGRDKRGYGCCRRIFKEKRTGKG